MNIEDRLAILQAIADYSFTFDAGDSAGWANLFTEDGVWQFVRRKDEPPGPDLNGRAEILAWAKEQHDARTAEVSSLHHQSCTSFDALDSDAARTRTLVVISVYDVNKTPKVDIPLVGTYHDEWKKTEGQWLIARRTLSVMD